MYGQPEITEDGIKCEECGKWYKKLTHLHLTRIHHLTIDEYKEKWGLCLAQPLEALYIKKIRQECVVLYNHAERLKPYAKKNQFKKGHSIHYEQRAQHILNSQVNGAQMKKHTKASRQKISASLEKKWQDQAQRKKWIASYQKLYRTPEMRHRMRQQSQKGWNDLKARKKHQRAVQSFWRSPEGRKYASERAKRMWANPGVRSRILATRAQKRALK